ncbi:MAG: zinc finger protein [Methanosarcina spindle-shaped virus 1]
MSQKITLPFKYELCQDCRLTFIPVSSGTTCGRWLCSTCAEWARVAPQAQVVTA